MNMDQVNSALRWGMTMLGTYLTGKGWISTGDYSTLTTDVLAVVGPAMALGSFAWSLYVHSRNAKIASVAAMQHTEGSQAR